MLKKQITLTIILLFSIGQLNIAYSQCESFSKTLLEIVKNENYENLNQLLLPIEQQRKILHWPDGDTTNMMLEALRDTLEKGIIASAEAMRENWDHQGLDFSNAEFVSCLISEGTSPVVTIVFGISNSRDSISTQTFYTDKIYIANPIKYKDEVTALPTGGFTIIEGNQYTIFSARNDEIEKAQRTLIKQFDSTGVKKVNLMYLNGVRDSTGKAYLIFLLTKKEASKGSKLLFDLENFTYRTIKN